MKPIELNETNFELEVLKSQPRPFFVIWAYGAVRVKDCTDCDELATEYEGIETAIRR